LDFYYGIMDLGFFFYMGFMGFFGNENSLIFP